MKPTLNEVELILLIEMRSKHNDFVLPDSLLQTQLYVQKGLFTFTIFEALIVLPSWMCESRADCNTTTIILLRSYLFIFSN